ncbi:hypothetical protein BST61_g11025 [Cercospora zeina]
MIVLTGLYDKTSNYSVQSWMPSLSRASFDFRDDKEGAASLSYKLNSQPSLQCMAWQPQAGPECSQHEKRSESAAGIYRTKNALVDINYQSQYVFSFHKKLLLDVPGKLGAV